MKHSLFEAIKAHPNAINAEESEQKILNLIRKNNNLLAATDDNQLTAMQQLSNAGLWTLVETIANKYDDADHSFRYGSSLLNAIKANETNAAMALINANAEKNWCFASTRDFAVHLAIKQKNLPIFTLLIECGAKLTDTNKTNQTAMHLAASSEFWEGVEYIAVRKKTDELDTMQFGWALLEAAKTGKAGIVKSLLHANALLPWLAGTIPLQSHEETPIEAAARQGHMGCVQLLLEHDRNLQKTPEIIESLHYEQTLLHLISAQNCALTTLLLKYQAPCNAWNSEVGNSALHAAIQTKNDKLVSLLIAFGANPFIKNKDMKTSVDIARDLGQTHLIPLLLAANKSHGSGTGKPTKTTKALADEKYQLLLDGAILYNIMPVFLENLLQSYRNALSDDLKSLDSARSTSKKSAYIESTTLLIQSIHTLRNNPENPVEVREIRTLSEKGFAEADNILHYLNCNNQIMDYAKRMRDLLLKTRIEGIPWLVSGFFGPTLGMPPQIAALETWLTTLKKTNCSCQKILLICMEIIKICSVTPDKSKPENHRIINFFSDLLEKIAKVSFENPIEKVALYPLMSAAKNTIQLVNTDNLATPVVENQPPLETLFPSINIPSSFFGSQPTEKTVTVATEAPKPALYSSLG